LSIGRSPGPAVVRSVTDATLLHQIWQGNGITPWELEDLLPAKRAWVRASMRAQLEGERELGEAERRFQIAPTGEIHLRPGLSAAERLAPLFGSRWRPVRLPNSLDLAELATLGAVGRETFDIVVGRARAAAWQQSRV
jgi:hypothetical protein